MGILKNLALAVFAAALVVVVQAAPARAYSNENMIDNAVFDAKDAMNEAQIRAFIQSRPNTCLTRVGSGLGGGNIFDEPMDYFTYGPNKVDAARVIYKAAQYNEINPRVILATLQKEQSMITDSDCLDSQGFATLNKAMGYACAEGGACPSDQAKYGGFERQVMKAVWQLAFDRQRAEGNTSWGGNDSITYGGRMTEGNRKRCGSCTLIYYDGYSVIDGVSTRMANGATASLYNYTPHRNQSFPYWFEYFFGSGSTQGELNESLVDWSFEALDGSGAGVSALDNAVGQGPKSLQFNNSLQVFYYDVTNGNLKRAYEGGAGWQFEVIDGASTLGGRIDTDTGRSPTALVYGGGIHVFYFDATGGDLRHAWSDVNGTNWQFETLDGAGGGNGRGNSVLGIKPTATAYNGSLQLFYYDNTFGNMRHAWYTDAGGWKFENLDGDPGSVGRANANLGEEPIVTTFGTSLQLFYYDLTNGNLRHAWADSGGWKFENLDGDPGSVFRRNKNTGLTPEILSVNGILHVMYYEQGDGTLRYAYADNTGWHTASLDGSPGSISKRFANAGYDITAVNYNGQLQTFYYDFSFNDLRHAWGILP